MQTTETTNPPSARGIHRRAEFARTQTANEAAADRRYAGVASIFVFVLCIALIDPVSQWAVGVALALLVHAVLLSVNAKSAAPSVVAATGLLAICMGQWGANGGSLPAGLTWALWLPGFAHNRKTLLLWSVALVLPLLWFALPSSPATGAGVVMALGIGWYACDLISQLRMRRAEAVFDTDEANAVILALQGELRPAGHAETGKEKASGSEQTVDNA